MKKSSVFLAGVDEEIKTQILARTDFSLSDPYKVSWTSPITKEMKENRLLVLDCQEYSED
ncbi:hypothetical protein MTR67_038567 [Solanum verrucosum]|uniref:Uncharacterized protein n=1 Tax=Solanum verrucosum TaxID=315347 RepID=A0AAF0ZMV8_SOLVR|nr:hypothetical protein MTR67_038567 [Solanum verrucosum]